MEKKHAQTVRKWRTVADGGEKGEEVKPWREGDICAGQRRFLSLRGVSFHVCMCVGGQRKCEERQTSYSDDGDSGTHLSVFVYLAAH